jgi:hypothetical protein
MVKVGSQKYERMIKKIYFHFGFSQNWLNLFVNQWHLVLTTINNLK